ncbi:caspase family protein, partial [Streptomyces sp. NPDC059272]|uniref:caspase family protein n=1 Tax=Streptomyces sp. NPDC059272 TaxID=3346800 RepID=UPI0036C03857
MYRALVVCNSDYVGGAGYFEPLRGPRRDHRLVADALTHATTGMFSDENLKILLNASTAELQEEAGEFFASAEPRDVLLFYYSGHGAMKNQKFYLCGVASKPHALLGTAVPSSALSDMMSDSSARAHIVVLDCCHSGGFKGDAAPGALGGKGRYVLAATSPMQLASDAQTHGSGSPFTEVLVKGLVDGAVDKETRGFITLEDLYEFVESVRFQAADPKRTFDGYGRIPVARRSLPTPSQAQDTNPPLIADEADVDSIDARSLDRATRLTRIDPERLSRFRSNLRDDVAASLPADLSQSEFLQRSGLMRGEFPTVTCALLFGEEPTAAIATAMVQCTRVYGTEIDAAKDKTDLRGTVPEQIEQARDFVAEHARRGEAPSESSAISQPNYQYPMIAVREIIANALVHRRYDHEHACVHIRLFDDRLEVVNPGRWFSADIAKNTEIPLAEVRSESQRRNFRLASVLTWARLVEGEGSGIHAAVTDCHRVGARTPIVVERSGLVTVTLYPVSITSRPVDMLADSARTPLPVIFGVMPPLAASFQHRDEIRRIEDTPPSGAPSAARPTVLGGMGGVGKTQLAAQYARTVWNHGDVDILLWVTAVNRSAIVSAYASAAVQLLSADISNPEDAAHTFLAYLHSRAVRWLVVLDSLADPADIRDLWPPATEHGRTIVTTRRRDAALLGNAHMINIDVFAPSEAFEYVTNVLAVYGRAEPDDDVNALAEDLGFLPLALSQAAAYIADTDTSCAAYRALLADRLRALSDLVPDALPDGQIHSITAAWSLSIDYADQLRPAGLARPMLQIASLLDPHGIPASVLTSEPALAHLTTHRTLGSLSGVTEDDANRALRALHRLSLLDLPRPTDTSRRMVTLHQMVQRATQDTLTPDQFTACAHAAADALLAAWPDIERDTAVAQSLRANATALIMYTESKKSLYLPAPHPVLFRTGSSIGSSGQAAQAAAYFDRLSATLATTFGTDYPDTLTTRNNLALWRGETGDAAGAATAFTDLLTDQLRVLGPDHP